MNTIVLTVTNDLNFDQRMQRICGSLTMAGYDVLLVGRATRSSPPLEARTFRQHRLHCRAESGKTMYAEYNARLLTFLLGLRVDVVVAIDLDTIIPCYLASRMRRSHRVYDAHELFTEMKEVVTRPRVQKAWLAVERALVPRFQLGYTVSESIAVEFRRRYGVAYEVIRNVPRLEPARDVEPEDFILYQGAVNEGRGLEYLIPAMRQVSLPLHIYGNGNFDEQARALVAKHGLEDKVIFRGKLQPAVLREITPRARIAVNLVEREGLNQYYSLANKFFDYIHAKVPQITMRYPEYEQINDQYPVALLLNDLNPENIAAAMNKLLGDQVLHSSLKQNCETAREALNWQLEEKKLIRFYQNLLG